MPIDIYAVLCGELPTNPLFNTELIKDMSESSFSERIRTNIIKVLEEAYD